MADELLTPTAPATEAPTASWRDSLPDDLKTEKSLESFKDIPALAKSYVETKKLVGQRAELKPLTPESTPEERQAFYKAIGVPATPQEYKLATHEIMAHPEWNQGALDDFVKGAHAAGFTPQQLNYAVKYYADWIGQGIKQNATAEAEAKVELRNQWGANFGPNLGIANRGLERMAKTLGVERADLYEATKGSDPALVAKLFHAVESQMVESGFITGEEPVGGLSPEEAQSKVAELQAQLAKVDPASERAVQLIDQIVRFSRAAMRGA